MAFTLVIGLETHVQLLTASKLFCGCSTRFGAASNTQTCPVCTGMPGSLPVMNRRAFELSLKTGAALNCTIARFTKWDRKNYFYPDLPKGYQISQYDLPLAADGWLEISDSKGRFENKRVGIIRAHLEEDAGKSMHDEAAATADSRIDLNRTGTPLLEIVTQPDLRSAEEAKAYLTELKLLLTYLGVSDCNMQEGSLRVDANVNLHVHTPAGDIATPIVEVKNMNSFRAVERALAHEAQRQFAEYQQTGRKLGDVPKQTRGWDDDAGITKPQRQKEESSDYRYFPDPDLVPVTVSEAEIERVHREMEELPAALRKRLESTYSITAYDADVLVNQGRPLVDYYIATAERSGNGKAAANWVQQDVLRTLNEREMKIERFAVSPADLAGLIQKLDRSELPSSRGRDVFEQMMTAGQSAAAAMESLGIQQLDTSELEQLCRELVAANPKLVADIRGGKLQAAGAFVGLAKKKNPNVDPSQVRELCLAMIQSTAAE